MIPGTTVAQTATTQIRIAKPIVAHRGEAPAETPAGPNENSEPLNLMTAPSANPMPSTSSAAPTMLKTSANPVPSASASPGNGASIMHPTPETARPMPVARASAGIWAAGTAAR